MLFNDIPTIIAAYLAQPGLGTVGEAIALTDGAAGIHLFDTPLIGVASADDALFDALKAPEAIGAHFMSPRAWLPEARSVISFFLPFTEAVRSSNRRDRLWPSPEWLHGRVEGQALITALSGHIADVLGEAGYPSVAPALDPRIFSASAEGRVVGGETLRFTTNWSERHAAYICGLGTFGLSKGLITEKGTAGRLGSVITALPLEPNVRPYSGLYDYCSMCGACARRCPAHAISKEGGKDHAPCAAFLDSVLKECAPRYGCGKCQTAVPCEHGIPTRT